MQQKKFDNTLIFEIVTTQEQFVVQEGDEVQFEGTICREIVETIEPYDFQTNNLCINEGNISDDEIIVKCHKEIALLEYLLEN